MLSSNLLQSDANAEPEQARPAQAALVDFKRIDASITQGVAWIYAKQNAQGNWEDAPAADPQARAGFTSGGQWGGSTALAVYALLSAGESPQDPRLKTAIDFLFDADIKGVYALAMRLQVCNKLPLSDRIKKVVARDAQLIGTMMHDGKAGGAGAAPLGTWPYAPGERAYSLSRGNYAALGLWAAAQMGLELRAEVWLTMEKAWLESQDPKTGGWTYTYPQLNDSRDKYPITIGMTAAGVASLAIIADYTIDKRPRDASNNPINPPVDRAMKYVADNFLREVGNEELPRSFAFATLYSLERVGLTSGLAQFGPHDWYDFGARYLTSSQERGGSWNAKGSGTQFTDTCFGVLFLSRGRVPLAIAKLDYSKTTTAKRNPWNNRPRDAANLTRWIGKTFERDFRWQIIDAKAEVSRLIESPILYIAGDDAVTLDDTGKQKIKAYIEAGGLVVVNADSSNRRIAQSIEKLGTELFGFEFRDLPQDHSIYTQQSFVRTKWAAKPQVKALSNGVRELIILLPSGDVGSVFQAYNTKRVEPWQLLANILSYTASREHYYRRGESYYVVPSETAGTISKRIDVARLSYSGNYDPEPGGFRRLSAVLLRDDGVKLTVSPTKAAELKFGETKIAHLTGTQTLELSQPQRDAIKAFVSAGGLLLIDSAGGDSGFAPAVEKEIPQLFGSKSFSPVPTDHAMLKGLASGETKVSFRDAAAKVIGTADAPRLQMLLINDRPAIIYSREDLSAGLVGFQHDGIVGYSPSTATAIVRSILLWSSK